MFPKFTIKKFAITVEIYPLFQMVCKTFDATLMMSTKREGGNLIVWQLRLSWALLRQITPAGMWRSVDW